MAESPQRPRTVIHSNKLHPKFRCTSYSKGDLFAPFIFHLHSGEVRDIKELTGSERREEHLQYNADISCKDAGWGFSRDILRLNSPEFTLHWRRSLKAAKAKRVKRYSLG